MMSRIRVPVAAYTLTLFPEAAGGARGSVRVPPRGQSLQALANGLAVPSFWGRDEITEAFAEANRIWIREADIEFTPVVISERTEVVPADENGMWIYFVNHLSPRNRGVGVGFVYDLPSDEGGWGGGRVAVIAGRKAWSGLPGFSGSLLAHELGHVLIDDPNHATAHDDPSNLMFGRRNPRQANAGLLNQNQVNMARSRAIGL
jgi:hypothetical protein